MSNTDITNLLWMLSFYIKNLNFEIWEITFKKCFCYFLFRYNNNHVSPTEIEAILQTHPCVKESLVFGKKDPKVQEVISAVIVAHDGTKVRKKSKLRNLFCENTKYLLF